MSLYRQLLIGVWIAVAAFIGYLGYQSALTFLMRQLHSPDSFTVFQTLSYTPLGLVVIPAIHVVSGLVAFALAGLIFYFALRSVSGKKSTTANMAPSYDWNCLACSEVNLAGTAVCSRCACPSSASQEDVRLRQTNKSN